MKIIAGYEGRYEISNDGMVWSLISGKYLKPFVNNSGYELVRLSKNGKEKHHLVHRLVAATFLKPDKNRPYVNHKDRNKLNNEYTNLEWVSFGENIEHAVRGGNYGRKPIHDIDGCLCPCHSRRKKYV